MEILETDLNRNLISIIRSYRLRQTIEPYDGIHGAKRLDKNRLYQVLFSPYKPHFSEIYIYMSRKAN